MGLFPSLSRPSAPCGATPAGSKGPARAPRATGAHLPAPPIPGGPGAQPGAGREREGGAAAPSPRPAETGAPRLSTPSTAAGGTRRQSRRRCGRGGKAGAREAGTGDGPASSEIRLQMRERATLTTRPLLTPDARRRCRRVVARAPTPCRASRCGRHHPPGRRGRRPSHRPHRGSRGP